MLKSAQSAIHSTQVSRKQQQHADVLINSIKNTALNNKCNGYKSIQSFCFNRMYALKIMRGVEVEKSQPFLYQMWGDSRLCRRRTPRSKNAGAFLNNKQEELRI